MGSVQEFFEGLPGRVSADRIAGMNNTYVFDIEGAGTWRVAVADGTIEVSEGAGEADCTFSSSAESFEPFTTHEPSRSSAVVRVAPASEPAPGSVSPNAARRRPDARSGSHRAFCSFVP